MSKYLILLFLGLPFLVFGQINESDSLFFQLQGSLNGIYQQGNVELFSSRAKLDFSLRLTKNFTFKSQNNTLHQYFSGFKADEEFSGKNFLYYKAQKKIYPFAMFFWSNSFRRKIDGLYFGGAGITWQALQKNTQNIKFSIALVYEQAYFLGQNFNIESYNGKNSINTYRSTLYLAGKHQIAPHATIFYDAYFQNAFNYTDNYRFFFDLGLKIPLKGNFSLQMLYLMNFERVVIQKIRSWDRLLTFGLNYQLNKH